MKSSFSFSERFLTTKVGDTLKAPMTLGSPAMLTNLNTNVFKKSEAEKIVAKRLKKEHKKDKKMSVVFKFSN